MPSRNLNVEMDDFIAPARTIEALEGGWAVVFGSTNAARNVPSLCRCWSACSGSFRRGADVTEGNRNGDDPVMEDMREGLLWI